MQAVLNVVINLDVYEETDEARRAEVLSVLSSVNESLLRLFGESQPQIMRLPEAASDLVVDFIEYDEYVDHDDCLEDGTHLSSCDSDGYCNRCGEQ